MGALGVGDNTRVILYDTSYMAWAARVWWMFRWVGFDNVAILDGGLAAWTATGHPLSLIPVECSSKQLTPHTRPELIADHDEVLNAIDDETVTLIDTLPEVYFRGERIAYARPGHIPGAINIDTLSMLDKAGHFRSQKELASLHEKLDQNARIITYCGGGIAASANAFVMNRLGFTNVAVYTESLQAWSLDCDNPMETEDF
jgi:thiosulfate/3-mercaptopyruvate sulfurtransferase